MRISFLPAVALLFAVFAGAVDARTMNGFDLTDASIPVRKIESGGPPRDGIPAINQPRFLPAAEAKFPGDDGRVMGVVVDGQARAYPIGILNWHEVVNDRIGDQRFVVTYCPLCGTGMVFESDPGDEPLLFGVSGLLYNSDVLLFDRNSESLWSQIMGEAVSGPYKGTELRQLPAAHTTWLDWRTRHPSTLVLSTETGFGRNYRNSPYAGYERSPRLYFDVANRAPRDYHRKALVMGLQVDGAVKAYPFEELKRQGRESFEDVVNGKRVTIHWNEAADSAHVTDEAGAMLASTIGFWFAWYAFHPETDVFKAPSG